MVRVAAMSRASVRIVSAGHAGDRRRPVGVLRLTVGFAHEIGQDTLEAAAMARQEALVVQALAHQRMRERQQHRGVGVRPDRNPFRADDLGSVLADRTDVDRCATPARATSRIHWSVECAAQPPFMTCVFFGLAPPNSTISLPCRAIDDHDVSGPTTACGEPITWGRNASAAPKL